MQLVWLDADGASVPLMWQRRTDPTRIGFVRELRISPRLMGVDEPAEAPAQGPKMHLERAPAEARLVECAFAWGAVSEKDL